MDVVEVHGPWKVEVLDRPEPTRLFVGGFGVRFTVEQTVALLRLAADAYEAPGFVEYLAAFGAPLACVVDRQRVELWTTPTTRAELVDAVRDIVTVDQVEV
jgi:hypothetical protein